MLLANTYGSVLTSENRFHNVEETAGFDNQEVRGATPRTGLESHEL